MANISVRKLPEESIMLLRQQAAKNGVSMEEEVRQILFRNLYSAKPIGDLAVKLFKDA
jgi:plasmid stability protein